MEMDSWEVFENVFSDSIFETPSEVHSLASSENFVCAGLRSGVIWVLDLNTNEIITLKSHTNIVNSLAIVDNILISGGQDTLILIWDLLTNMKIGQIPAHDGIITGFSVWNSYLYSCSIDQTVKCFDYSTVCKVYGIDVDCVVCCIKASSDKVFLGCEDGSIRVALLDLQVVACFEGHLDAVWCIDCFCGVLISCSYDGSVRMWDCESGAGSVIGEHEGVVNKIGIFDPSNAGIPLIVSVGSDKAIKLWALEGIKDSWKFHTDSVSSVVILDTFIITAGFDKKIRMWSLMNNLKIKKILEGQNPIQDFCIIENDLCVIENEKIPKNIEKKIKVDGNVNCIFQDSNRVLVGVDEILQVFDLNTGELIEKWELGVKILKVVSKNNEILVCGIGRCFFINKSRSVEQLIETGSCGDFSHEAIVLADLEIKVLNKDLSFNSRIQQPASCVLISRNSSFLYTGTIQGVNIYLLSPLTFLCKISLFLPITQLKLHPDSFILASTANCILLLPEYDQEKQMMFP